MVRSSNWIMVITAVALVACTDPADTESGGADGGSSGVGSTSSEGGSTSVAEGSGGAETTAAAASSDSDSDSDSGSGSGDSSGGPGSCEVDGDLLYPLETGRVWTYELLSSGCNDPVYPSVVTSTETIGGREAFVLTVGSDAKGCGVREVVLSQNGQTVESYNEPGDSWLPVIEEPIEDGAVWSDGFVQWEAVPEVTVPAGTFTDCWRAASKEGASGITYCPGIGPVAEDGFEISMQLVGCG